MDKKLLFEVGTIENSEPIVEVYNKENSFLDLVLQGFRSAIGSLRRRCRNVVTVGLGFIWLKYKRPRILLGLARSYL